METQFVTHRTDMFFSSEIIRHRHQLEKLFVIWILENITTRTSVTRNTNPLDWYHKQTSTHPNICVAGQRRNITFAAASRRKKLFAKWNKNHDFFKNRSSGQNQNWWFKISELDMSPTSRYVTNRLRRTVNVGAWTCALPRFVSWCREILAVLHPGQYNLGLCHCQGRLCLHPLTGREAAATIVILLCKWGIRTCPIPPFCRLAIPSAPWTSDG